MFSATDLANFVACPHIATLEQARLEGKLKRPYFQDPGNDLLRELGREHEQAFLKLLEEERKLTVARIETSDKDKAVSQTLTAMKQGAPAIYQAALRDGSRYGRADFLIKVDRPSGLGLYSYEVVDTKLARSARVTALIQLCFYSEILSQVQERDPEFMHLVLGGTAGQESFRYRSYAAYFRHVQRSYSAAIDEKPTTYPEPVEHCRVCDWSPLCEARRHDDDHLSLVAGISSGQRKSLKAVNVDTVIDLARLPIPVTPSLEGISDRALTTIREQARIQVEGREAGRLLYELFETVEENKGLAALPPPSRGDMFLDFEGDPFAFDTGLEYLIGVVTQDDRGTASYESHWAFNRAQEKHAFEALVARIMEQRERDPGMHVYHYAPYEVGAIKRLAGLHATCTDEVDDLLRKEVFVDLYQVVRQGLRASVESYSIKKLEPLFEYTREVPLSQANDSLTAFAAVLVTREGHRVPERVRGVIQGYNRDDCLSALKLRDWLEERRIEWEGKSGSELPRLTITTKETSEKLTDSIARVRAVEARLLETIPENKEERSAAQQATWLLAKSLEWHRRDEKATWWEYFRLCDLTEEERLQDATALEGLTYVGPEGVVARSVIHRYRFPAQEFKISVGDKPHDPKTQSEAGEVVGVDEASLTIDLKRGKNSPAPHPTALIPLDWIGTTPQRESLVTLGEWVAENGVEATGPFQAARDILLLHRPNGAGRSPLMMAQEQEPIGQTATRLVAELDNSTLPVQGPPGSGKTYNGARMVLEMVANQKRVGITGPSHKVISNLLENIVRAAREQNVELAIVQKAGAEGEDGLKDTMVTQVRNNEQVREALQSGTAQIAAGTAWLWSREDMANSVDVLFVDEAGQVALANVLAVSQGASSLVLLGDPQQLDQPQKGVHPEGTGVSALSHLLDGHATIDADHGLFLKDTWRLHPDVCDFTSEQFYDGKLIPEAKNRNQRLNAKGVLDGTGLRFIPVEHHGNKSESTEEVKKVVELVETLLRDRATWTDREGVEREVSFKDILIVAPYNAQAAALKLALPGADIGTVDKFQGQEAPIVIYSMAASSAEDAPRGMEFLYSLNRLNVAISRARCVAVIVASPALFDPSCKTPRQAELANALCRFLEMAKL